MKLIMPESPAADGLRLIRLSHEMNVCGYLSSSGASLQEVEHVRAYMINMYTLCIPANTCVYEEVEHVRMHIHN